MNRLITIADKIESYRPDMTHTFRMTILGLGGASDVSNSTPGAVLDEENSSLVLTIANDSFQEPTLRQGTVSFKRANLTIEFPGQIEAFSSTSKFTCFIDSDSYGKLYAWKCQSGNHETGEVGDPRDYWKDVTVEKLTGKGELVGTWHLHNCWLSELSGETLDNNTANIKTCTATLKYFRPEWRKA